MAAAVLSTNGSSYMALPEPMLPALDDTLGAMLIGAMISTMSVRGQAFSSYHTCSPEAPRSLYGLTLNQISRYYELYPVDTPLFRIMVSAPA